MSSRRLNLQNFKAKSTTNAGLWLQKFLISQEKNQDSNKKSAKQALVDEVSQIEVSSIYETFYRDIWVKSLEKAAETRVIKISGRMIVGLGSESVLETSITLHRTYGVPYIPGSALKGLAASYAHRFMDDDWKKETKKTSIGEAHKLMFGSQNSAGFVIFHDALYVPNSYSKTPLRPDILTVHHQKYYEGKGDAPADWDSPVPIPLLSAQGQYLLAVSANSGDAKFDKKMRDLAIEILELALRDEGIGAKTSSGYGRAEVVKYEKDISIAENIQTEKQNYQPIQTADERQEPSDQRRLDSIKAKLQEISDTADYKKHKNDLAELRKRIRKIEDSDLKKEGAELFVSKFKKVSKKTDEEIKNLDWFKEINIPLK